MSKTGAQHGKRGVHAVRPGEGVRVELVGSQDVTTTGATAVTHILDFSKVPVPDRHYVADKCSIVCEGSAIKLLFGQKKLGSEKLRSLLVVHLSPSAANQFRNLMDEVQNPSISEIVGNLNLQPELLDEISAEPRQTVALSASIAIVAVSGTEACIDFYNSSPFVKAYMKQAAPKNITVDPVVRVEIRTTLLQALIDKLGKVLASFDNPRLLEAM
jgi:hypothetical protein